MTASIVMFLFGGVTAALALQLPLGTLRVPGTGLFPLVLGVILMALAGVEAFRKEATEPVPEGASRRVAIFMGAVVLSVALLQPLGYVASAFLLMLGLLRALGARWGVAALIGAGSAAASYVLFVQWLRIPMPAGPLGA
jgi:hypothetical protein